MKQDIFAAIDVGSNAFRLLISHVEHDKSVEFKKAAFIRVPVRLGEDVFSSGSIGKDKWTKVVEAMQGFAHLMKAFDVKVYRACATSAMREAANGAAMAEAIRRTSGIEVEIISGQEEASLIFEAGDTANLKNSKCYLYIDVGGGSTEAMVYSDSRMARSESFTLGTVRMMIGGAVKKSEKERFKIWLRDVCKDFAPVAIVGSGGNINRVRKMLDKKAGNDPLHYPELRTLHSQLDNMSYRERMEKFRLNDYRADVIVPALEIFLAAADTCHIDEIIVPKIGLVDGIIHQLYLRSGGM